MNIASLKTDYIGIIASLLCMIHCIITPFLFLAKTCSTSCCSLSPNWWRAIDFMFLVISFFAIYQTSKNTTTTWVKYALWSSWASLFLLILNENLGLIDVFAYAIYIPAILLIGLHFYNLKYCQCSDDGCCVTR
jgi:hypothetical protein